jgi:hypothetical protein
VPALGNSILYNIQMKTGLPVPASVGELGPLPDVLACEEDIFVRGTHASSTGWQALNNLTPNRSRSGEAYYAPLLLAHMAVTSGLQGAELVELVNDTTRLALRQYAGLYDAVVAERLYVHTETGGLLCRSDSVRVDGISRLASEPLRTQCKVRQLAGRLALPQKVGFMPLLNGGYVPGVQAALHYQRERPKAKVVAYPMLFSRRKAHHTEPKLTDYQAEYLREILQGGALVVYDDDASCIPSGTMTHAIRYLRNLLDGVMVYGLVGIDNRTESIKQEEGEWWELVPGLAAEPQTQVAD